MNKIFRKAQSTTEYVLLLATVILVMLVVLAPWGNITIGVHDSINVASSGIECMADSVCFEGICTKVYSSCTTGPSLTDPNQIKLLFIEHKIGGYEVWDYTQCSQCGGGLPGAAPIAQCHQQVYYGQNSCETGYAVTNTFALPVIDESIDPNFAVDCNAPSPRREQHEIIYECTPI